MKNNEQKYSELIIIIREEKPILNDPHALTADILSAVEKLSDKATVSIPLKIISWVSSVACVLLLGVFLLENARPNVSSNQTGGSNYSSYLSAGLNTEEGTALEKVNDAIKERRALKNEREAFYTSFFNNFQYSK